VAVRRDGPVLDQRGFASAAPAAQTGENAFRRAQESGKLSGATTLAAADAAAEAKAEALTGRNKDVRRIGGRVFSDVGGVWTDVNHSDSLRVITVAPFSKAYFAIARALPELKQSLTAGDALVVAGRKASLKVAQGGRETLSDAEVREFVRAFRGA
jgi:hypothetical protein